MRGVSLRVADVGEAAYSPGQSQELSAPAGVFFGGLLGLFFRDVAVYGMNPCIRFCARGFWTGKEVLVAGNMTVMGDAGRRFYIFDWLGVKMSEWRTIWIVDYTDTWNGWW